MGLLGLLTLPVLGGPKLVAWLAKTLTEEAERELLDEDLVRGQLLELQTRLDMDEIAEEEYDQQESFLLERLSAIREAKAQ
ncbi:MAG: gas vesicle protein GvpG [Dehalococcoidia bacterium]|nr:gas vesicle protein GvpG [Dehalococcoidia bacterium]